MIPIYRKWFWHLLGCLASKVSQHKLSYPGGYPLEFFGGGVPPASPNSDPISDCPFYMESNISDVIYRHQVTAIVKFIS